jgi:DNA topoisomerase-3
MKLCIAEKPSVARDLAEILGAKKRKDGYFEGNGYWVSWTIGHLCTLKEPHDYKENWKAWRLRDLPIIPSSFGIKVVEDNGIKRQFECLRNLISHCEEVINCGDAGQEGELIQRWVLRKAGCKKPVKRLWISSLTEEAIREGFQQLKDASSYDNLYAAGSARAIGDWLLGINATRAFTKKFGDGNAILSIGRVQTPTLAMIVQRHKEIQAFHTQTYWELKTRYRNVEFSCQINRLPSEERAQKGLDYLKEHLFEVTEYEQKDGKESNPRLFDLTSLQVEANKKHAYSADETLKHVQNLYEKKLVTYPRVDTTYLPEDMYPKISGILSKLTYYSRFTESLLAKPIPKSKTVFDNKKVTDHHAIMPTGVTVSGISPEEQKIYDLITRRFIAAFYPECKVSNTTVMGKVDRLPFKVTGKQILDPGWRVVFEEEKKAATDKNKEEEPILPHFEKGETGPHEPFIHKGKTSPPKPYTEATLLRAMETAGKQVDNEEMRELMKDSGIGRPSTRANIIETLFRRKYIEKQRKNILPTQTGIGLIETIDNQLLKSPELTGQWEQKLRLIEKGEYAPELFKSELFQMVREVTDEVIFSNKTRFSIDLALSHQSAPKPVREKPKSIDLKSVSCLKCKAIGIIRGKTAVGCMQFKTCGFKIPFEYLGKRLTDRQLMDLLLKGKTGQIKGFTVPGKSAKTAGCLYVDNQYNLALET